MSGKTPPLHVSLVAIPGAAVSTLTGIYDVLGSFTLLSGLDAALPSEPPFRIEIVSTKRGNVPLVSGVPVEAKRGADEIDRTDIVMVPSVMLAPMAGCRAAIPS
jgi:hypothetical protein